MGLRPGDTVILAANHIILSPRLKPTIGQDLPSVVFPFICFAFQSIDGTV